MGDCFKPNLGGVSQHNYFKYNKTKFEKKRKKKRTAFLRFKGKCHTRISVYCYTYTVLFSLLIGLII